MAVGALYAHYAGLPVVQALFYGILTAVTGSEPVLVIVGAGLLMILLEARPRLRWRRRPRDEDFDPAMSRSGPTASNAALPNCPTITGSVTFKAKMTALTKSTVAALAGVGLGWLRGR